MLPSERANEYMTGYNIPRSYASHTELLADHEVEAVAVTLGHQLHHRLTIPLLFGVCRD